MECEFGNQNAEGPASRTRSRKGRKIRPLQEVASASASPPLKKGSGRSRDEDHQANSDQRIVQEKDSTKHEKQDLSSTLPSKPCLLEKRVLELILDILQRRDTHEIFAEPVDPEEVEDYYEIIKEPMDFGTMRAKLHEGMYQSLEQFEHDVFLITKNAMHFNSSATIYFRQARAINELATKVFHLLKAHPERFELEFLESRRRNSRRPQGEAGNSVCRMRPRIARNVKSGSVAIEKSSKSTMSLSAASNSRKRTLLRNWCSGFGTSLDARDQEVSCDAVDDARSRSIEAERRCTYEPSKSFVGENKSIFSTISSKKNQLELVIQQDISYRESLMLFAKDLGPVVQMVARQKLLGLLPVQKSSFSMISSSNDGEPSSFDSVFSASICQNFHDQVCRPPSIVENSRDRMDLDDDKKEEEMNIGNKMGATRLKVRDGSDTSSPNFCFNHKLHENQSSDSHLCSSGDFNFLCPGFKNAGNKSTTMIENTKLNIEAGTLELAFEHSHSNSAKLELKIMDTSNFSHSGISTRKLSSCYLGEDNHARAEQGPLFVVTKSCEAGLATTFDQCKTSASQFTFDLPYLKARLGQTNSLGQNTFLQQSYGAETTLL